MPNTKLSDILKHSKIKVKKIDFNDPEFIKMVESVIKEKKRVLKMKEVDWNFLNRIRIK
jgi:hypothetical protein